MKFLLVVSALAAVAFSAPSNSWRILGGEDAYAGQFPYIVSIRYFGSHMCGGSILDETTILTAAHCVDGITASFLTVVTGTNKLNKGGDSYQVVKAKKHAAYNKYNIVNDIAIIKLGEPIEFNHLVQPIELETREVDSVRPATLCGWGKTTYPGSASNALQYAELKTLTFKECEKRHSANPIYDTQICTFTKNNQGACHGDSGGPLTSKDGKQIGIVSWGIPCGAGYPDVFTRVSSYTNWISQNRH